MTGVREFPYEEGFFWIFALLCVMQTRGRSHALRPPVTCQGLRCLKLQIKASRDSSRRIVRWSSILLYVGHYYYIIRINRDSRVFPKKYCKGVTICTPKKSRQANLITLLYPIVSATQELQQVQNRWLRSSGASLVPVFRHICGAGRPQAWRMPKCSKSNRCHSSH